MVNILINGVFGKMGRKVAEICQQNADKVKVVCGIDCFDSDTVFEFPIYDSFDKVTQKVDVIIDFSVASTLDNILKFATKNSVNAVLCTTGYTAEDIEKIDQASNKIAIFRSANMSYAVNVLVSLVKKAAEQLGDFDVEIIEKHHNQKKDAPSGTALMLANAVKSVQSDKYYTYGREGMVGKRDDKEIGIHAIRGGNIVGDHDVLFAGINETITLSHQATDRSVFAIGAVKAAIYLGSKKTGKYNMQDIVDGN